MNSNLLIQFKKAHQDLKLSHHPFDRSYNYLKWAFKGIDFKNKKVLDIGGGNGIYSYYAKFQGAKSCINLEPLQAGSTNVKIENKKIEYQFSIQTINQTFQNFRTTEKFDIIILHDSINHLDEDNFCKINTHSSAKSAYLDLIKKMCGMLAEEGEFVISDCSRYNFWGIIGLKSPFAPSIDWNLHQSPYLITKLFEANGLRKKNLRWSPFKRFGSFGRLLTIFGFPTAFFMQSHFNLKIIR